MGVFGDPDDHAKKGGLKKMGEALDRGVVLVLSLWDDYMTGMDWLDETTKSNGHPGNKRGPCPKNSGKPEDLRAKHPDASVKYGNIKYGEIGSTVSGLPRATSGPPAPVPAPSSPSPPTSATSASSSAAGYCCFASAENGKADSTSWCSKSEANCKDCGMGVWCPEAEKSSGSSFPWILKDDDSSGVLKEDNFPGRQVHPALAAGAAFAGTGFIALIAAVVIASRVRWGQRSYEQLSGATTLGVAGQAALEPNSPAQ